MIADFGRETLDDAFERVRDLDLSLQEQLRTFAATVRRQRPKFAAAVDRLVERLRQYSAGESAPRIGEPMPPFVLPDEIGRMVSLEELLNRAPVAVTFHRGHWCPYCRININHWRRRTGSCLLAKGRSLLSCPTVRNSSPISNCGPMCRFPSSRTWTTVMPSRLI